MKKLLLFLLFPLAVMAQNPSATGNITAQGTTCATTNACIVDTLPSNAGGASITVSGTFSATLQFEVSGDGVNFVSVNAFPPNSTVAATSTTAVGTWTVAVGAMQVVRVRCSTYSSGTAVVTIQASPALAAATLQGAGGGGGGVSSFNTRTGAVVPASGDYTCSQITGCTSGSVGSPSASLQANNAGTFASVPFELFPHLAPTETGTGIEASPWANPTDNAAGIATQFTNLATRGGKVDLPSGRFNIANGTTISWTIPGIDIRGGSWSIGNGGNGSSPPNYATTLRMGGSSAPLFNVNSPTYPTPVVTGLADEFSIWGGGKSVASTNNSCFVFGNGASGFLIHHVGLLNCGYGVDMGPDSSDGGLNLTEGLYITDSNFNQSGYGFYLDVSKWWTHSALIDNFFGENDQQPIYAPATTNVNGPDYGLIVLANQFSQSCRMSSCSTDPSHIMWGENESILMANFSNNPGNCPSYDPACGSGSVNPSDGMVLRGSNNVVAGNLLTGSTGSKVGIHIFGSNNRIYGNGFLNNAGGDILPDTGANDNIIDEPGAIVPTDLGSRNVFQNISRNAGDPNSTGVWNGHAKWTGLFIRDTTDSETWLYLDGSTRQEIPDASACINANTVAFFPSPGNLACSTNFTYNPSNIGNSAQLQLVANGANNQVASFSGSGTSGISQVEAITTTAGGFASFGMENQPGQFAGFLLGDSTSAAPFNSFAMTGPASGTALPINIIQRQNAPINFYCNSTSATCLVGAASGNWEFKNQLTVDSFASASSTPVCSNSGTLATCTGISSVLTGTTGSIGGSALLAGQCTAGTVTVTGATSAMVATASPSSDPDSNLSTGVGIYAFVSSSNTVTVRVCAIVAVTPAATTYNVRVLQ